MRPASLLGPVFASGTHGYDTVDHFRIDPRLGDDADFDALVAAAHGRGLRVLLDGVFNHVGREFPAFVAADGGRPGRRRGSGAADDGGWVRRFEGHDRLVALNHDEPAVAELRRRRDEPLARRGRRRLAPGRGLRRATGVLGAGTAPGAGAAPRCLLRG